MEKLNIEIDHPAFKFFVERRKKKYDTWNDLWWEVSWSDEAMALRQKVLMEKKQKVEVDDTKKGKISHYVKKKLGITKTYKPRKVQEEVQEEIVAPV
jgi:hypothetical protein